LPRNILLLAFIWILSVSASAQGPGGIRGVITDQSGALVPGAQVMARGPDGAVKQAVSGADGSYLLNGLAPGKYAVRATAAGLSQPDAATVDVSSAVSTANLTLRIVLENQQVTVQDQLSVEVNVDPSQSAAALVVNGDNLDALSDDPDDLLADLQALAGPAAGPSGAQFYIDGFTAGDAAAKQSVDP